MSRFLDYFLSTAAIAGAMLACIGPLRPKKSNPATLPARRDFFLAAAACFTGCATRFDEVVSGAKLGFARFTQELVDAFRARRRDALADLADCGRQGRSPQSL